MTNEVTQKTTSNEQNVSSSNGLEPLLRFCEFKGNLPQVKLSELFHKCTQKNRNGAINNVICNSAKNGLIPQRDFFDKDIANSENTTGYYIIKNNDFVYNPRKSNEAPYGPVSIYKDAEDGIVSPLYLCFRATAPLCAEYFKMYFKSPAWHRYVYLMGDSGARHDRVSIKDEVFFDMPVRTPSLSEQQKIADFLSLVDARIEKQRLLVESLKKYKRGYFQRIISAFNTHEYMVSDIVEEYNKKTKIQHEYPILSSTMSGIKLQNDYFNKQAASEDTVGYKIVPSGYFTYRSMSDTGEFHFNLQDVIENGIVSPAYPVFKVIGNNSEFVEYILNETDEIKSQLLIKKEGGTRYALSFSKFKSLKICLPTLEVQDKFVTQLNMIDNLLYIEAKTYDNLQRMKKGFLQQMFI